MRPKQEDYRVAERVLAPMSAEEVKLEVKSQ